MTKSGPCPHPRWGPKSKKAGPEFPHGPAFEEREKGLEPSTSTLARWHSTTELLPRETEGSLSLSRFKSTGNFEIFSAASLGKPAAPKTVAGCCAEGSSWDDEALSWDDEALSWHAEGSS